MAEKPMKKKPPSDQSDPRDVLEASTVGLHLVVAIFIGFGIGWWLDGLFGTSWMKIVWLIFGIIAGYLNVIREIRRINARERAREEKALDGTGGER